MTPSFNPYDLSTINGYIEARGYVDYYSGIIRFDRELNQIARDMNLTQGTEELRALAAADGSSFSAEWLKGKVGELFKSRGQLAAIKAMSVREFADAILTMSSDSGQPADTERTADKPKRTTVNARMLDLLMHKPESRGWTAHQWSECLNCAEGTIKGTAAWKGIMTERAGVKMTRNDRPKRR